MTKYLNILLLLNLFFFNGCKTPINRKITHYIKNDGDTLILFGSVKSVQSVVYEAFDNFGKIKKGKISSAPFDPQESLTFDIDGTILTILTTHSNGLSFESSFKNGDLIEQRGYKNGNLIELTLFKRFNKVEVERKLYLDSTLFEFEKSTLDENGKVIKIEYFDKKGNTTGIQRCKYYYNHSFLVKEEWFNDKNELVSERQYDKSGNKIKSIEILTEFQSKKKDTTYTSFEYSNKKVTNEVSYNSRFSKAPQSTKRIYNSFGKLIKLVTFDKNAQPIENYISDYDNFGNLISFKFFGDPFHDEFEHTISYEFDKNNNWIKSIEMKGIIPLQITERQIAYN